MKSAGNRIKKQINRRNPFVRLDVGLRQALKDPEFAAAVRGLNYSVRFVSGRFIRCVRLSDRTNGALAVDSGADDIVLEGPALLWTKVLSALPPPGHQSLTALARTRPAFSMKGDPIVIARCLHALERLLELARKPAAYARKKQKLVIHDCCTIRGRYRNLCISDGTTAKIYYETAGRGAPLVLLHTAGADSRQYHELICDTELGKRWRMYAFDMPLHGRSFPPVDWCFGVYKLTAKSYAEWCAAFIREVVCEPAVVMGCSMGAAISVVLAAEYAELLRGVIALEAPDRSPGRLNPFLFHSNVNQAAYAPAYVRGLMSPTSPQDRRRLAGWYYSQGGLGIYAGDLRFYSEEYNGIHYANRIDGRKLPVYFLTGEYDYSASPASTRRLAKQIRGSNFQEMKGLGHFPMTENPDRFREYLVPILCKLHPLQRKHK